MEKLENQLGAEGHPITIFGTITVNRPQNTSWVYTGVPRKMKMYAQDTPRSTGFSLRRMIAAVRATTVPSTIAPHGDQQRPAHALDHLDVQDVGRHGGPFEDRGW